MDPLTLLVVFLALLLGALLLAPLARAMHLPFALLLLLLGYVGSEYLVYLQIDTGLRWYYFKDLIFLVLLPVLVFDAALQLSPRELLRELPVILLLAIPLLVLTCLLAGALCYWLIGHPTGFPILAALLTGCLLAATDPAAVMDLLKQDQASPRMHMLLEGESLFNDATAIVLFGFLLLFATATDGLTAFTVGAAAWELLRVLGFGLGSGLVTGFIAGRLLRRATDSVTRALMLLATAYLAFLGAELLLHSSGVIAALVAGLYLGQVLHSPACAADEHFLRSLWRLQGYLASVFIFVLAGATITLDMFREQWLAMLIGIIAALLARSVSVIGGLSVLQLLPPRHHLQSSDRWLLNLGGIRGAITLALALSLPLELDYWWTVQSIAYGVVVFGLVIQAPLLGVWLGRKVPNMR